MSGTNSSAPFVVPVYSDSTGREIKPNDVNATINQGGDLQGLRSVSVSSNFSANGVLRGDVFGPALQSPAVGNLAVYDSISGKSLGIGSAVLTNGSFSNITGFVMNGTMSVDGDLLLNGVSLANALTQNGSVMAPPGGSTDRAFVIFQGTTGMQLASGPGILSVGGDATGWVSLTVTGYLKVNTRFAAISPASTTVNFLPTFAGTDGQFLQQSNASVTLSGDMTVNTISGTSAAFGTIVTVGGVARGDVFGPSTAVTAGTLVVFNTTTGKLLSQTSLRVTNQTILTGLTGFNAERNAERGRATLF